MGGTSNRKNPSACARQAKSRALLNMDVYETPTTGRAPDDYQPRKCLKDLYEQNAISAGNPNTIAAFCATYSVEEKHVIEYLGHLNDINIRKDIRTREAKEKKRLDEKLTYKHYQ